MTIIRATIAVADLFSFFYRGVLSIILADALQSYDLAVYSHLIKMKSTFNRAVPIGYDQILILESEVGKISMKKDTFVQII